MTIAFEGAPDDTKAVFSPFASDMSARKTATTSAIVKTVISEFTPVDVPRLSQLINKSNQFNLTTRRRSEAEVAALLDAPDHDGFSVRLRDRFGDHGLIAVVVCRVEGQTLDVDTWLMSCRVLKRGVERMALNALALAAKRDGAARLVGEYIRTPKNALVQAHYRSLGFTEDHGRWVLELNTFVEAPHFIRLTTPE